jgi:hypothetical protein
MKAATQAFQQANKKSKRGCRELQAGKQAAGSFNKQLQWGGQNREVGRGSRRMGCSQGAGSSAGVHAAGTPFPAQDHTPAGCGSLGATTTSCMAGLFMLRKVPSVQHLDLRL